mmetsp:Transcript_109128/g.189060  ORF Transcript_109128/g.189060 Transcript_109128/m.189060 type:complete len:201 (-) Transcript_109128:625-1227(-)
MQLLLFGCLRSRINFRVDEGLIYLLQLLVGLPQLFLPLLVGHIPSVRFIRPSAWGHWHRPTAAATAAATALLLPLLLPVAFPLLSQGLHPQHEAVLLRIEGVLLQGIAVHCLCGIVVVGSLCDGELERLLCIGEVLYSLSLLLYLCLAQLLRELSKLLLEGTKPHEMYFAGNFLAMLQMGSCLLLPCHTLNHHLGFLRIE